MQKLLIHDIHMKKILFKVKKIESKTASLHVFWAVNALLHLGKPQEDSFQYLGKKS